MMDVLNYEAAWEHFVRTCTTENIKCFLQESCEREWLVHVNRFNLDAQLEFIERNALSSMLVSYDFSYPLWALESSELLGWIPLVEAYKALFEDYQSRHFFYEAPEQLVHVMSRDVVRARLGLPPLSQEQIDAFYAQPQVRALPRRLSPYPSRDDAKAGVSHEELMRVVDFLQLHYPDVVAYWVTLLTKAESQGYVGWRGIGGHSTPQGIMDSVIAYFISDDLTTRLKIRAAILDHLTGRKIEKSGWLHKW